MEYSPGDAVPSLDRVPAGVLELVRNRETKEPMAPFNGTVKETIVPALPYIFRSEEHMHKVMDGPIGDQIKAGTPQYAMYGFAVFYAACLFLNWWFYLRRGAWVAAANRAEHLLETYPQSMYQHDAVAVIGEFVLADYIRKTTFKTIHGNIKFGANGEWESYSQPVGVLYGNASGGMKLRRRSSAGSQLRRRVQ